MIFKFFILFALFLFCASAEETVVPNVDVVASDATSSDVAKSSDVATSSDTATAEETAVQNVDVVASEATSSDATSSDVATSPDVTASDATSSDTVHENEGLGEMVNVPSKGEKLEEEIDQLGKAMPEPETVVVHEVQEVQENTELKINDEMDLKKKLENFTMSKFKLSTTEKSLVQVEVQGPMQVQQYSSIVVAEAVGDGLEHEEPATEEEHPSEKEFVELSDSLKEKDKERKESEVQEASENANAQNAPSSKQFKNQEAPKKENFISEVSDAIIVKSEAEKDEKGEKGEKKEEDDDDWISWDLIHFLLLLSPYDEDEVTWWTIIFEAVKCSLRNCPNASSYWHHRPVYLPRITRHRRQDSEFSPEDVTTTAKPCGCQNLENYFEQLYESIEKSKKENSTESV